MKALDSDPLTCNMYPGKPKRGDVWKPFKLKSLALATRILGCVNFCGLYSSTKMARKKKI